MCHSDGVARRHYVHGSGRLEGHQRVLERLTSAADLESLTRDSRENPSFVALSEAVSEESSSDEDDEGPWAAQQSQQETVASHYDAAHPSLPAYASSRLVLVNE